MMHTQIQSNYYFLTGSSIDIYNISPKSLWKKRQQQQQNITLKQTLFILSALLCFESSFILCRFFPLASHSFECVFGAFQTNLPILFIDLYMYNIELIRLIFALLGI